MPNLKQIQTKIKSVWNLKKITRALEVVSTIKLQKTKEQTESLRTYLLDLLFIIDNVAEKIDLFKHKNVQSNKKLVIVVTTDKWLCWSMNSKLLKDVFLDLKDNKDNTDLFVIWKKWLEVLSRAWFNIVWSLSLSDNFVDEDLLPIYVYLKDALELHLYNEVQLYFNFFKSTLDQRPTSLQIFPLNKDVFETFIWKVELKRTLQSDMRWRDMIVEPNKSKLTKEIYRQIRNYIIQSAIIQNKTWEHASRMISMKNSKDNSNSIISHLTLSYNKARQAAITQEISEIVSAKIAMED